MNPALQSLIDRYQPRTLRDWENALKEIVQELALLGLWRAKFYEHAAFYGLIAILVAIVAGWLGNVAFRRA